MKLIRREKELASLMQAYTAMLEKKSLQFRFICGEAGSGKTVLTDMFQQDTELNDDNTLFVSTVCGMRSEYSTPYQPFKELLKNLLQDIKEESTPTEAAKKKKEVARNRAVFCAKAVFEHAPKLIGNFVPGVSVVAAIGQSLIGEYEKKIQSQAHESGIVVIDESKILEQYVDAIQAIAEKYNLVFIIDHLQWIDKSSINLWSQLARGLAKYPVMFVGCYRSSDIDMDVDGQKHPAGPFITEMKIDSRSGFIDFDKAGQSERKIFMNLMLDSEANTYGVAFRDKLFQRTNGNPLFVSEMVLLLKEQGVISQNAGGVWETRDDLRWDSFPVRIEGIMQERIGHLEDSLIEVLTHASVQGHNFVAQVLSKTLGQPDREVLLILSRKLQKQYHLVNESDAVRVKQGIMSRFNFSNYVFQQYLYQELSPTERMLLHNDVASTLADLYQNDIETAAGEIARHYELAEDYEKAVEYSKIAVEAMMRISAYEETKVLCQKAISMLEEMGQDTQKLYFLVQLGVCVRSIKGWGDPEVVGIHEQTKQLSEKTGDEIYYPTILFGIGTAHLTRMEFKKALEVANEALEWSKQHNNQEAELMSAVSAGNNLFWMGKFDEVNRVLGPFAAKEDAETINYLIIYMFDLLTAQQNAEPEKAQELFDRFLKKVEAHKNPFYKALGYHGLSLYAYFDNNLKNLETYSKKLCEYAQKYCFAYYDAIGDITYGAYVANSDFDAGMNLMVSGYELLGKQQHVAEPTMHSIYVIMRANAYLQYGKTAECLAVLDKAISVSIEKDERCYLDELFYLKGQYYLRCGQKDAAQEWFDKALGVARENGAKRIPKRIEACIQRV
jgi:tetratricopeptide (TPR) repeat protein